MDEAGGLALYHTFLTATETHVIEDTFDHGSKMTAGSRTDGIARGPYASSPATVDMWNGPSEGSRKIVTRYAHAEGTVRNLEAHQAYLLM